MHNGARRMTLCFVAICSAMLVVMPNGIAQVRSLPPHEVRIANLVQVQALESASGKGTAAFLKESGFTTAWSMLTNDVTSTVAVIDTGVDLNNPLLKPYLLPGKNFVNANRKPQDDNGHGTAVAGIIAAVAEAGETSGKARWKGRILPIKALDQNGSGDESKLTQAIAYAVEQGADIIVLSLGLKRDAPNLREAVEDAENKGVLLVAASGNDAAALGSKAAVQYPAAYASVLAVSGSEGIHPIAQSTAGPEVDLSASWTVDTLAIGGGRVTMVGSSMGAPQVAAAAAMLKAMHPEWKPIQLREKLRGSAIRPESGPWDESIGYGFLAADDAVKPNAEADWREPNDTRAKAAVFPLGKEVAGAWSSPGDVDWYTLTIPYSGTLAIRKGAVKLSLYAGKSSDEKAPLGSSKPEETRWQLQAGEYWLKVSRTANTASQGVYPAYKLTSSLAMAADAREPNDSAATASTLPSRSQQWTGTFHKRSDEDWTTISLPKDGEIMLSASADTSRIDLALMIQPAGGPMTIADERGDGGSEQLVLKQAKAGKYYIRITNAVSANPEPVIGTYTVALEYITQYEDPYEPNNSPATATPLVVGERYAGIIATPQDVDWYRFTLSERKKVHVELSGIVDGATATIALRDRKQQTLNTWHNSQDSSELAKERVLDAGTYYVSVAADRAEQNRPYRLLIGAEPTQDAFIDLAGYRWANPSIQSLVDAGWLSGYSDGTFHPGAPLARGEAIVSLVRALELKKAAPTMRFKDIAAKSWLSESVAKADQAGWLSAYKSSQLHPSIAMTRAEAAELFAAAIKLKLSKQPKQAFKDVSPKDPFAATAAALREQGWLSGYSDGKFKPNATISRAEWSVLLAKLLKQSA
ncbi:S8 family serine peptidase [Cohnella panacarvi]|uniref:S8 family serine peptidase n=1 Tax=Cohnella panacarvi TaxID=400776 RepID=UPI00047DB4AF|nr:S8 family serine peptidase [Cohnella panacarvi]